MRNHIEKKLDEAELNESPFPYLVIQNFFPDDVFQRLLEYNPFRENAGQEWLAKSASANVSSRTPYHARKQINFHVGQSFEAPAEQRGFWDELTRCFLDDDWFPDLVRAKYPYYFRLRFGDLVDDPDFTSLFRREFFLQRHEPGYYIGPHTDIATRIFTCIFSFADRPGFERFGTELLIPTDRLTRCWGNDHYGFDGFKVAEVAPYAPNNFLLFFKTRHSFHSVQAIDETVPNQRYGMQFQFYEPPGGLFNDLSEPDLMHVKSVAKREPLPKRVWAALRG